MYSFCTSCVHPLPPLPQKSPIFWGDETDIHQVLWVWTHRWFTYWQINFADYPDEESSINSFNKCIPDVPCAFFCDRRVDQLARGICRLACKRLVNPFRRNLWRLWNKRDALFSISCSKNFSLEAPWPYHLCPVLFKVFYNWLEYE